MIPQPFARLPRGRRPAEPNRFPAAKAPPPTPSVGRAPGRPGPVPTASPPGPASYARPGGKGKRIPDARRDRSGPWRALRCDSMSHRHAPAAHRPARPTIEVGKWSIRASTSLRYSRFTSPAIPTRRPADGGTGSNRVEPVPHQCGRAPASRDAAPAADCLADLLR